MQNSTIDLLKYLAWTGAVEINNLRTLTTFNEWVGKENIYFCAWLPKKLDRRCNDDDFEKKRYFVVDIDIRENWYSKHKQVLDDEQLSDKVIDIIDSLNGAWLCDFSAYVLSGNWLHLYYTGTERVFDKKTYSDWVEYFYQLVDSAISKTECRCDPACKNLARIMRLPWSINPRTKKKNWEIWRDLEPAVCELINFTPQTSQHFENLEQYANELQVQKAQEKKDRTKIKNTVKNYSQSDDVWAEINTIPARQLAEEIWGVEMLDKGIENEPLREWHKNMGAYWYRPYNIIVNTGSSLINTDKKTFTSYELVLYEKYGWDKKLTLEYFESKWYAITNKNTPSIPEATEYENIWYVYPWEVFEPFKCLMSWELAVVVAESNSWKTTFAMNLLQENNKLGKKWFYINLEFKIETVAKHRRLHVKWLDKTHLTDINKLTPQQKSDMDNYVRNYLSKFDYHNEPRGMDINALISLLVQKNGEWYGLFVLDSFSRITGNLDNRNARTNQNKSMELLQEVCQNTGICLIMLHHTNKAGSFEWSQKIMDLANVFINIKREKDEFLDKPTTVFTLTKDKFVRRTDIETVFNNWEYLPLISVNVSTD